MSDVIREAFEALGNYRKAYDEIYQILGIFLDAEEGLEKPDIDDAWAAFNQAPGPVFWDRIEAALHQRESAPQPDHSPDAGKVVQPDHVPYNKHESECGKLIDERDHAQDWADKLAGVIGEHFGIDIGEHSNCNCPWETAFDNMPPTPAADGGEVAPVAGLVQVTNECFKQVLPWNEAKRQHSAILSASKSLGTPGKNAELIPLYTHPDQPRHDVQDIEEIMEQVAPRIDPDRPEPLDPIKHCCEATLYRERERIHGEIVRLRSNGDEQ